LGGGLGHVRRLSAVVRHMVDDGWDISVASSRILPTDSFPPQCRMLPRVQIPAPMIRRAGQRPTETLADILDEYGFGDADWLRVAVQAWTDVLDAVRPSVVMLDYAPALRLACLGRVPVVVLGNGFTIPPAGELLPPLRPWDPEDAVPAVSRAAEARLINVARTVRGAGAVDASLGVAGLLLRGEQSLPCTLPLFDPHGPRRRGEQVYWPPTLEAPLPACPHSGAGEAPTRVVAYLPARHPALRPAVGAIVASGLDGVIYAGGPRPPGGLPARVRWSMTPLDIRLELAAAGPRALALHHGGLGATQMAYLAGVPQLCLPESLEHHITSRAIAAAGSGSFVSCAQAVPAAEALRSAMLQVAVRSLTQPSTFAGATALALAAPDEIATMIAGQHPQARVAIVTDP
jgi:hypothetical protein